MKLSTTAAAWALAAGTQMVAPSLAAEGQPSDAGSTSSIPAQRVEIQGTAPADARQLELTSRIVVPREALLKFGDRSLRDALRRVPGVTVDGELRLRGLGQGYTQILIDGDPAPAGFSIDSLDPETIERVEILRAPSAEYAMRGIAGTIHIVLRKRVSVAQRSLKLGVEQASGRASPSASLQWQQQAGALQAQLSASASLAQPVETATITDLMLDPAQQVTGMRRTAMHYRQRNTTLNLTPRLTWKDERQTLSLQALLQHQDAPAHWTMREDTLQGAPSDYPASDWRNRRYVARTLRADLAWTRQLGDAAQLDAKLGLSHGRRDTDFDFQGFATRADADAGRPALDRAVHSNAVDDAAPFKGKFSLDLGDTHRLALGWDGALLRRSEQRQQRDRDAGDALVYSLDQDYTATVRQLALFAQDEWRLQPGLELYLGLRWEGLNTEVTGLNFSPVRQRSSVPSPVAQLVWKLPDRPKEQLRLALARTYKAPAPASLVPRRYTVNNGNSPSNPDQQGNPALRPELAWGLDAAYEAGFGAQGFWSVGAHLRRIDAVVMRQLFQDGTSWVSTLMNNGAAWVWGAELEWKAPLRQLWPEAPALNLSASLAWNASRVDRLPGPHNVLAAQQPLSAHLGADWTVNPHWTLGASLAWRAGTQATLMAGPGGLWDTRDSASRTLDAYALCRIDPRTQLRLGAANLLRPTRHERTRYLPPSDAPPGAIGSTRLYDTDGVARLRLQLERQL